MQESDTSHILRPLPPLILQAVQAHEIASDDVIVATDTDLDIVGEYSESWVIVTKERVLVFYIDEEDGEALLQKDIAIAQIETARTDTRVGSGFLEVKTNDIFEELARFSNKNADKFARVAQRIKSLAQGKQVDAEPETEAAVGRCEKVRVSSCPTNT